MTTTAYDGDGLRQSSASTPAGGSSAPQNYVWNTQGSRPQVIMDGTNAHIYAGGQAPAEQVNLTTGASTYLVADSLGSIRGAVSSSGSLTCTTSYDAWGNPETPGGLTITTPFGYAGGYTDFDGLLYLINRYYEPATGQFLSVDPMLINTQQPYAYADGNPVNLADPNGESVFSNYYIFSPWRSTYRFDDPNGILESAYNFHTSPGTYSWRYQVQPALCLGGEGAALNSDVYNNGGLVPGTHYSKVAVSPCYGFHGAFANPKINYKGNYQLRGVVRLIRCGMGVPVDWEPCPVHEGRQ
jgi:RHS repeat-associated protein